MRETLDELLHQKFGKLIAVSKAKHTKRANVRGGTRRKSRHDAMDALIERNTKDFLSQPIVVAPAQSHGPSSCRPGKLYQNTNAPNAKQTKAR